MANPTTNFGWVMPTSTSLVTNLPADFNTFGQGVDTSMAQLKGGTTGQVLSKTNGTDMAFTWVTPTDQTPLTTKGDLFAFSTVDARLAVGANETRLVADSTQTVGLKYVADTTNYAINAKGDLLAGTAADTLQALSVGTNGQTLVADSSTATGLKWATAASGSTFSGVAVSNSAAISVPDSTFTALTFDTEQLDSDGYHSTSSNTSRITIPAGKTGKFLIIGAVTWNANAVGDRYLSLRLNGSAIGSQLHMGTATGKNFGIFETIYSLAAADYIELFAYQASGGSLNVRCDDLATLTTRFQAIYLGA